MDTLQTTKYNLTSKHLRTQVKVDRLLERMIADKKPIWERLPYEPIMWYARFRLYLALGVERSVSRACHYCINSLEEQEDVALAPDVLSPAMRQHIFRHKHTENTWRAYATVWQWMQRAEAWDQHMMAELAAKHATRIKQAKMKRLEICEQFATKVSEALLETDFTGMPLSQFALAIKTILEQSRIEFEGAPSGNLNQHQQPQEIRVEFARPVEITHRIATSPPTPALPDASDSSTPALPPAVTEQEQDTTIITPVLVDEVIKQTQCNAVPPKTPDVVDIYYCDDDDEDDADTELMSLMA